MADQFYLTPDHVQRLSRLLNAFESGKLGTPAGQQDDPRWIQHSNNSIAGFLSAEINKASAGVANPNSGTLNIYSFSSTGTTDTGETETVYNLSQIVATTDVWTFATRERNGKWVINHSDQGRVIVGYLDSAITGIANINSNPETGTLSIYTFSSTGQTDSGKNQTVYHFATVDATTDRWTQCKQDYSGKWVIDYQACSTT